MRKKDNIFEVSLAEIAFILTMLLILLLGYQLWKVIVESNKAKKELNQVQMCLLDPDDPVTKMMPCIKCIQRNTGLTKTETEQAVELGLALLDLHKKQPESIPFKSYAEQIIQLAPSVARNELQDLAQEVMKLNKERMELQKQLQAVTEKLNESKLQVQHLSKRNGLSACWLDQNASVEFMFNVFILPDQRIRVTRAWPPHRDSEMALMPTAQTLLKEADTTKGVDVYRFLALTEPIFERSQRQDPECRYYINIHNRIPDRKTADRIRLMVEKHFYKREILERQ